MPHLGFIAIIFAVSAVVAADDEATVCRFFSNGDKACQRNCNKLASGDADGLVKKRSSHDEIPQDQIDDASVDPLVLFKCTDDAHMTKWDVLSDDISTADFTDALKNANKDKRSFVGSCAFHKDKSKGWDCLGVQLDNGRTKIGRQSHHEYFFINK
ncbi:uncharacterized protein LOC129584418 [Paramacrobiotus metropolitanus]|uniref:uncharacterized protein LOC129584418 n=1 Tax=Paramacrobiotus metropolitanus TaxID=2943436 RepID=UPI00244594EE|nr:uncharacterized protein LOC129584418 [Paramacrobiotus metropolitanus]